MILYYLLTFLYVAICFILLLVILLQQGKGGDMASAFGGGSSQTAFGARGGATLLTRMTTVFAVLFMLGAMALAILGQRGPGSLLSGLPGPPPAPKAPVAPVQPVKSTPATPGPASSPAATPAPMSPSMPPEGRDCRDWRVPGPSVPLALHLASAGLTPYRGRITREDQGGRGRFIVHLPIPKRTSSHPKSR